MNKQQESDFTHPRTINWINRILTEIQDLDHDHGVEILHRCGAACCETASLIKGAEEVVREFGVKGDRNQLFQVFKDRYFNVPDFVMNGDQVELVFETCTCPMVQEGVDNPFLCNCTVGYSKKIFETLFNQQVEVVLEKSILRGDSKCVQHITLP